MQYLRDNVLCLLFLWLVNGQAFAAPTPLSDSQQADSYTGYLKAGNQFFNEGNYAQAKTAFEQALELALQQGQPVSSLYYNLGSVCYRLQQYEQSRRFYKKLADDEKLAAVAYYNIALIDNQQDRKSSAIFYFNKSRQASNDEKFTQLVDRQLEKLKQDSLAKTTTVTQKDWHAYFYLSTGYDSNIEFAPLETASNESGSFAQAIGIFDKVIAGKGTGTRQSALLVTSSVFLSNYFSTDFNDFNQFDIGLRYAFPLNRWRNKVDLNLKKLTYGHEDYQRIESATFRTRYRFANKDVLRLRYRYEQIESLDQQFDYLEGNRQRLRAGYQFIWPRDALHLWYELEFNDRENTVNRNYSPTRNTLRLRYEKRLNDVNMVYGEMEYRHSKYDPTPVQDRDDNRSSYLLAYVYDIKPDWQLMAKWRFRSNRSTDPVFSYDRHVAMLTLRKLF